jgi:hypothetical protein
MADQDQRGSGAAVRIRGWLDEETCTGKQQLLEAPGVARGDPYAAATDSSDQQKAIWPLEESGLDERPELDAACRQGRFAPATIE